MHPLVEVWPLYGLRVVNGDMTLCVPDDAQLAELCELARAGMHDPATMPFSYPWTDAAPDERARSTAQFHWRMRAEWSPADWHLPLVAVVDGTVVGTQSIQAKGFAATGTVETGSWVGRPHQGRGVATAMRHAVLHLAFAGLRARMARSGAFSDNHASLRVSERLGYVPDGTAEYDRRGATGTMIRLKLTRGAWEASGPPPVRVEGLDRCLAEFGAGAVSGDAGGSP